MGSRAKMKTKERGKIKKKSRLEGSEAEAYLRFVSLPQSSSFVNSSGR